MRHILIVCIVLLVGCGKEPTSSETAASITNAIYENKDLFSKWVDITNLTNYLDVSKSDFGTFPMKFLVGNDTCSCRAVVVGRQVVGTAVISECVVQDGLDPGCSSLNGSFTYAKTDTRLKVCVLGRSDLCTTYR
jgi:hypothetical protein